MPTYWECRATATANNVNGGGFVVGGSGTDYTQQDAAQWTNTDLSTSGAGATTVTSAGSTFDSSIVDNYIHITAGTNFVAGWYRVTAFTDANNIVLASSPTPAGAGSGGTFYVGGAMSLNSALDDELFENGLDGDVFWIKAGTYTLGESINISVGGTTNAINITGYNTTRGDGGSATLIAGSFSVTLGSKWNMTNINIGGTATTVLSVGSGSIISNCNIQNLSDVVNRRATNIGNSESYINGCYIHSRNGYGINLAQSGSISGCVIYNCDVGMLVSLDKNACIHNNLWVGNKTAAIAYGITQNARHLITSNTFYGAENKLGICMSITASSVNVYFGNNIIYGFVTGITHATSGQDLCRGDYNNFYNNTTDRSNFPTGDNDVALDPQFTNVAQVTGTTATYTGTTLSDGTADFSNVTDNSDYVYIISGTGMTAGIYLITAHTTTSITTDTDAGENATGDIVYQVTTGNNFAIGTNLKALGFPNAYKDNNTISYVDIGAVQRQEASGGALYSIFNPLGIQ